MFEQDRNKKSRKPLDVAEKSPGNWIRLSVLYELGVRLAYQMALAYQPKFGLPMNLKLPMAGTIFATAPIVAFAQNEPADQAPKSTLADAQKVVSCLSTPRLKADQTAACPNPSREVLVDQLIGRTTSVSSVYCTDDQGLEVLGRKAPRK